MVGTHTPHAAGPAADDPRRAADDRSLDDRSLDDAALLQRLRSAADRDSTDRDADYRDADYRDADEKANEAFGELYERHVGAVRGVARTLSTDSAEAEDITAETFFRVLQALRRNAGPRDSARAYLLTVARRVCWEWQSARREVPTPDTELAEQLGPAGETSTVERTVIARAFSRLPERWRVVLWQTEVEGVKPALAAPHFGLNSNATAALARRARLGLRAAYLQEYVTAVREAGQCRTIRDKLGGYTVGMVTGTQARRVRAHLRRCPACRAAHGQLRDVFAELRVHADALVVLVPAGALAAAGAGSGAGGSAASAALLTAGAKLKIGLAVAATTAAGAMAATPVALDWHAEQTIGMPNHGAELPLATSSLMSSGSSSGSSSTGHDVRTGPPAAATTGAAAGRSPARTPGQEVFPAATVPPAVSSGEQSSERAEESPSLPTASSVTAPEHTTSASGSQRETSTVTPRAELSTATRRDSSRATTSTSGSSASATSPTSGFPGTSTTGSTTISSTARPTEQSSERTDESRGEPSRANASQRTTSSNGTPATTGRQRGTQSSAG